MSAALTLFGVGLGLLAPVRPARQRLAAMAGARLPGSSRAPVAIAGRSPISLRWLAIGAGAAVAALIAAVAGPVPAALAAACAWPASIGWRQLAGERKSAVEQVRLAEIVSALAAEHAAGSTLAAALPMVAADAGSWRPALLRAGQLAAVGGRPALALAAEPRLAPLAVALGLADRTGTALTDVLDRLRADVLTEQGNRRAVAEAVAGPRSSAILLAALPVIGVGMGMALGAQPLQVLTRTTAGLVTLVAGVLLEVAGLLWTLRLTR